MTDEQRMRERFESDCLHIDEGQLARTEAGDYAIEWVHGTWIGYAIAYKARDAEVQALRGEVRRYRKELVGVAGSYSHLAVQAREFMDTSSDMDAVARAISVARFGFRDEGGASNE